MAASIHPLAVVEPGARLGAGVAIGPFCHVGGEVDLGEGVHLVSHVVVAGRTRLGARARVFPFAVVGSPTQDLKSAQDEGTLMIGDDCVIREGVTVNAGTRAGGGETRIGARCAFLAYSHVAHDCRLGNDVVLSNNVLLGGHVEIGDHAMIGGGTAVHQHARIGAHAFVGGLSGLEGDLIPFGLAGGNRAHLFGLNLVGLRRHGYSPERIARLRAAYRLLFAREAETGDLVLAERVEAAANAYGEDADVATLIDFLRAPSQRPLCAPRPRSPAEGEVD
jgi:UDP-N-acetylglucosamine acyltransferase